MEPLSLPYLPHDVLLTILEKGLGPRELCRLEVFVTYIRFLFAFEN